MALPAVQLAAVEPAGRRRNDEDNEVNTPTTPAIHLKRAKAEVGDEYPADLPLRADLPFSDLTPGDFQEFCVGLASTQFAGSRFIVYGKSGESQDGIDVKPLDDGLSVYVQCKRYQEFKANHIRDAFKKFRAGKFGRPGGHFILAVTAKFESKHLIDEWERCRTDLKKDAQCEATLWDYSQMLQLLRGQFDLVMQWFGRASAKAFCGVWQDPYLKYPCAIEYVHWNPFLEELLRFLPRSVPELFESLSTNLNHTGSHMGCRAIFETSSMCEVLDTQKRHTTYDLQFFSFDPALLLGEVSENCAGVLRTWLSRPTASTGTTDWIERIIWFNNELDKHRHNGLFALVAFSRKQMEMRVIDHHIWMSNEHLARDSSLPSFQGSFIDAYRYLVDNGLRMEEPCNGSLLQEEFVTIEAYWNRAHMDVSWHILPERSSYGMTNDINSWAASNYKGREVTNTGVKMFLVSQGYRTKIDGDVNLHANIEWKRLK